MELPAGIAVLNGPEHVYELVNPAYDMFTGDRAIMGKRFVDALPELADQEFLRRLDDVYRTGIPYVGNEASAALRRGPGGSVEQTFFNFVYQPLHDERGLTTCILNFAYEVTEQVNARRKMEHLADELREEHRRKDDAQASAVASEAAPTPLSILVVDDNEDAAHMLSMLLEDAGHEVMTEGDPVIALERAQATRPDVFVLDIGLPRMDGHELARRLRASPAGAGATLIALTGYGQPADRERAARAGFDHYLVKPVDPVALERLLSTATKRSR